MFRKFLKNNIYVSLVKNKKYKLLMSHASIMAMLSFCIYGICRNEGVIQSIVSGISMLGFYYYCVIRIDKKLLLPVSLSEIRDELNKIKDEDKKEIFKKCISQNMNEDYLSQYDFIMIKEMINSENSEIEKNKYFWLKKYNNKNKNEKMIKIKESLDLLESKNITIKDQVQI